MSTAAASSLRGDSMARIELALDPRFAVSVIGFDDGESARGLFEVCEVAQCLRARRTRGLCSTHLDRWRRQGRPSLDAFLADPGLPTTPEQIRLVGLEPQLRNEIAMAVQLVTTRPRVQQIAPSDVQRLAETLAQRGATSILAQNGRWSVGLSKAVRTVLAALRDALDDFVAPPDSSAEFDRDVCRLSVMGHASVKGANGRLRFDAIPQPWLRQLVKRFMRWRIATGRSYHQRNRDITALQRMADAFTAQAGNNAEVVAFTRETIEAYLASLVRLGLQESSRCYDISSVSTFPAHPPAAGLAARSLGIRRRLPRRLPTPARCATQGFTGVRHGADREPRSPRSARPAASADDADPDRHRTSVDRRLPP